MNLEERVATAIKNYEGLESEELAAGEGDEQALLHTSLRLPYALGWIVANEIVQARFFDSAIDAVPIFHPENGWDRFLLSRRVACRFFQFSSADECGQLLLTGEDAPRLERGSASVALGRLLRDDPQRAIASALELQPPVGIIEGPHDLCWHRRADLYPTIFDVITELVVEHPGLIPAREIYVDDQQINGTFHPLYLNGVVIIPQMTYDWLALEYGPWNVFFRVNGDQTLYDTGAGSWSTLLKQLTEEPDREGIKRRILSWLRIEGQPDPKTVD